MCIQDDEQPRHRVPSICSDWASAFQHELCSKCKSAQQNFALTWRLSYPSTSFLALDWSCAHYKIHYQSSVSQKLWASEGYDYLTLHRVYRFTKTIKLWSHGSVQSLHPIFSLPPAPRTGLWLDLFHILLVDMCHYWGNLSFQKDTFLVLERHEHKCWHPDNICIVRFSEILRERTTASQSKLIFTFPTYCILIVR